MMTRYIIMWSILFSMVYTQGRIEDLELSQTRVSTPKINKIIYKEINRLVDYFQNDIKKLGALSTGKDYEFSEKDGLWIEKKKEDLDEDIGYDYNMLSENTINIAILEVNVGAQIENSARRYLYQEVMSRYYETSEEQKLYFIDTLITDTPENLYKRQEVKKSSETISKREVAEYRKKAYFDYYAKINLIKKGIKLYLQIVFYDVDSNGVVLLLSYERVLANAGGFIFDFDLYYTVSFNANTSYMLPMQFGLNLGKKLPGIGAFGLNMAFGSFYFNEKTVDPSEIQGISDNLTSTSKTIQEKLNYVGRYFATSLYFGPYFTLNINELARKRTSIFEFLLGMEGRMGYYLLSGDQSSYQPIFFDYNLFFRTEIGHWFLIQLGVNFNVMIRNTGDSIPTDLTRVPFGLAIFYLSIGLNIF